MSALADRRAPSLPAFRAASRQHWPLVLGLLLAESVRIVFWAVTGRRYEDALITLTHSENAARGLGLIHHPQEGHVHGFTSALSVLIPFAGELVHHGAGMATIKTASLFAAAATITYAYAIARRVGVTAWPAFFLVGYLALDYNQIIYAMGGMETQLAVAILLAGAFHVMRRDTARAGILLGLALLVRPDFILWIVPAVVWLFMAERRSGSGAGESKRTLAIALAVVAPWLIFTSLYYGSPIPHTLVAKSTSFAQLPHVTAGIGTWISYFHASLLQHHQEWTLFAPFLDYAFDQTGPAWWLLSDTAFTFIVLALSGLWLSRKTYELRPLIVYGLVFYAYTLLVQGAHYFQWYLPPFMAVVALMAAVAMTRFQAIAPRLGRVLPLVLVLAFAAPLPWYIPMERTVQHIDDSVRTKVGLYLKAHVKPDESVTSESAGYIGYYGRGIKLWDFPGLTSPTAQEALAALPPKKRTLFGLINALKPDWLVLRAPELIDLRAEYPRTLALYSETAHFSIPEAQTSLHRGPVSWLNIDRDFYVLRRARGTIYAG